MEFERNETNKNSNGGTEQMMKRIYDSLPEDLLNNYQIIPSRVRNLDPEKLRVYYVHDLADDPESKNALDLNGGWARFNKIVFVSNWQRTTFLEKFPNIPWSKTAVLLNAIEPFDIAKIEKPTDKINLIYHTTPHRGLNILASVLPNLKKIHPEIHLDVFSSFELYGWKERDKEYQQVFDALKKLDYVTLHETVDNATVRSYLEKAHIFAYPSIWPETSCICLMEAMAAGCYCVHPDYAALPETGANFTMMYAWDEDVQRHCHIFYTVMDVAIQNAKTGDPKKLLPQMAYANTYYNWEVKKKHWEAFLLSFKDDSKEIRSSFKVFEYEA